MREQERDRERENRGSNSLHTLCALVCSAVRPCVIWYQSSLRSYTGHTENEHYVRVLRGMSALVCGWHGDEISQHLCLSLAFWWIWTNNCAFYLSVDMILHLWMMCCTSWKFSAAKNNIDAWARDLHVILQVISAQTATITMAKKLDLIILIQNMLHLFKHINFQAQPKRIKS